MTNHAPAGPVEGLTTFGDLLRHLRRRMQMTQSQLGLALGYSVAMIARLESGERLPDLGLVKTAYVEALGLQHEPELATRLVELAAATRAEVQPAPSTRPPQRHPRQRPGNLPAPLTRFVGRGREIAEVLNLLGANRLVTLTGAGGTGKTRLALEVGAIYAGATHRPQDRVDRGCEGSASPLLPAFADGVWLAELAALADPGLVADAVLSVFGASSATGSATEKLIDSLRSQDMLLILDNCEHLVGACAELVEALLRACPSLSILATSREVLGVPGELVWRVPSLELGDAIRLFEDRARTARPGFAVIEYDSRVESEICERLDGMPLALELAAAQVRVLSVEQIAERLEDRFRLLTGGARTALPRHQTLKATLDWSYALLWPEERTLFQRLSVFAGGWTLEAAEQVCSDAPPPLAQPGYGSAGTSDLLGPLTALADKSLVLAAADPRDGRVRYRLLETLRQYAAEKLREADQADTLRERHLAYYLAFAERADAAMAHTKVRAWKALIQAESGNLRAALEWCKVNAAESTHAEAGLRMAVALALFWYLTGYGREAEQWLWESAAWNRTLQQAGVHSTTLEAQALYLLWARPLYTGIGHLPDPDELAARAEACLARCRAAGDRKGEGYCLLAQRKLAGHRRDFPHARALTRECLSVFEDLRDLRGMGLSFRVLVWNLLELETHTELNALLERYIKLMQALGDRYYYADLLLKQASSMLWLGERGRAADLGEQALAVAEEWDDPPGAWQALYFVDVAEPQRALPLAERWLARQRQVGDAEGIAVALHQLGEVLIDCGEYGRARSVLDECVALMRALGPVQAKIDLARSLASQALAARCLGDYPQALVGFDESLQLMMASGRYGFAGWVLFHHGLTLLEMGDVGAAAADFRESLRLYQEQAPWVRDLPPVLFAALAEMSWARGQPQAAMRLAGAAAAFEGEERYNNVSALIEYKRIVAAACARLGDPEFAAAWAEGQAMTMEQAVAYALTD